MERSLACRRVDSRVFWLLGMVGLTLPTAGCQSLFATGVYLWQGGNVVAADCDALRNERVVVVCRPPSSQEYRYAGAARSVSQHVSELLAENVRGIDVVNPRDVDNWADESDWGDFRELARGVHADKVVHIELDDFELYKGKTLYQGRALVRVAVYDMKKNSKKEWDRDLGEILYPKNSGIPAQDKPVQQFEREFVGMVAQHVAESFYPHDPNSQWATDALATR